MQHADYSEILEVGCICAGHMEEDISGARRREDAVKSAGSKRKRWPNLKGWRTSKNGNPTLSKDGYRVTIFKKGEHWSGSITDEGTDFKIFAKRKYPTELAAKLGAFNGVIWLQTKKQ
jgi:hypothetical protein